MLFNPFLSVLLRFCDNSWKSSTKIIEVSWTKDHPVFRSLNKCQSDDITVITSFYSTKVARSLSNSYFRLSLNLLIISPIYSFLNVELIFSEICLEICLEIWNDCLEMSSLICANAVEKSTVKLYEVCWYLHILFEFGRPVDNKKRIIYLWTVCSFIKTCVA